MVEILFKYTFYSLISWAFTVKLPIDLILMDIAWFYIDGKSPLIYVSMPSSTMSSAKSMWTKIHYTTWPNLIVFSLLIPLKQSILTDFTWRAHATHDILCGPNPTTNDIILHFIASKYIKRMTHSNSVGVKVVNIDHVRPRSFNLHGNVLTSQSHNVLCSSSWILQLGKTDINSYTKRANLISTRIKSKPIQCE